MKITKYTHSCIMVQEQGTKILIDPGTFSSGFETEAGIAAVLYTHQHADHYDSDKLAAIKRQNPNVRVIADKGTAAIITDAGGAAEISADGISFDIEGVTIEGIGSDHAVIHPSLPLVPNVGYLVAGRLFHPGDAFILPGRAVEMLALPIVAPWSKVQETADYLLSVSPKLAFPIHEAVTSMPEMYMDMVGIIIEQSDIELRSLAAGGMIEA